MEFKSIRKISRLLDPRAGFVETRVESEVRFHPLTGRTSRVAHFSLHGASRPDPGELIAATREKCPFCPQAVDRVTPMFPADIVPQGRLRRNEATVVPNLFPYDAYSALTIMTRDHYVPLSAFTEERLSDAFALSLAFLDQAGRDDPEAAFGLINWNYMPYSGGSQIHPHLQVYATATPGNLLSAEIEASRVYQERNGRNFWADLITAEQEAGERWLGAVGNTYWCTAFAPLGVLGDILAVFPDSRSCRDLTPGQIGDLARGLLKVFAYYESAGIGSFNLAFYPGPQGQDYFWTHAVVSARTSINPVVHASDINTLQHLYGEPFCVVTPEELARKVRAFF